MGSYITRDTTFYAARGERAGFKPMYRAFDGNNHFYTSNKREYDTLRPEWKYVREGIAFYVKETPGTGFVPLLRFYNGPGRHHDHKYLASTKAPEELITAGWRFEKIEGYVAPRPASGLSSVLHGYNGEIKNHFYTVDDAEYARATSATSEVRTPFDPKVHGFKFENRFSFSVPIHFLVIKLTSIKVTGLCGGMVLNARKRFERGTAMPTDTSPPATGTPLFNELLGDQYVTLQMTPNGMSMTGKKFYDWQLKPTKVEGFSRVVGTKSIGNSTSKEWPKVRKSIDQGRPAILGLIRVHGITKNPSTHHQVLAIGYRWNARGKDLVLYVYDPNEPLRTETLTMNLATNRIRLYDSTNPHRPHAHRTRGFFIIGGV